MQRRLREVVTKLLSADFSDNIIDKGTCTLKADDFLSQETRHVAIRAELRAKDIKKMRSHRIYKESNRVDGIMLQRQELYRKAQRF